jgi:DNA-binding NtrC family response regulator
MNAKVLLVDNYQSVHNSLCNELRLAEYDVTSTSSEQEALAVLRDKHFDIVLLDVIMPAPNAWDAFQVLVARRFSLPIVIITGCADTQWLAAQEGIVAVLEKPVDLPVLLDAMKRALAP